MVKPWLRLFRVVNLPTVPGDVLAGASAALVGARAVAVPSVAVVSACLCGVFLYMFGLADNDIVGAPNDKGRPIPDGLVSLRAARAARGLCLFVVLVAGAVANLPPIWWIASFLLAVTVVVYNRTHWCVAMGLCRGLNVICGALAVATPVLGWSAIATAVVWTAYIAGVTRYSEGEDADPEKKRRVGFLIGALVYLQLTALLVFTVRPLLIAGAVMLVALRLLRRMLPEVSAS